MESVHPVELALVVAPVGPGLDWRAPIESRSTTIADPLKTEVRRLTLSLNLSRPDLFGLGDRSIGRLWPGF